MDCGENLGQLAEPCDEWPSHLRRNLCIPYCQKKRILLLSSIPSTWMCLWNGKEFSYYSVRSREVSHTTSWWIPKNSSKYDIWTKFSVWKPPFAILELMETSLVIVETSPVRVLDATLLIVKVQHKFTIILTSVTCFQVKVWVRPRGEKFCSHFTRRLLELSSLQLSRGASWVSY